MPVRSFHPVEFHFFGPNNIEGEDRYKMEWKSIKQHLQPRSILNKIEALASAPTDDTSKNVLQPLCCIGAALTGMS